jgi:hypothetical protein
MKVRLSSAQQRHHAALSRAVVDEESIYPYLHRLLVTLFVEYLRE